MFKKNISFIVFITLILSAIVFSACYFLFTTAGSSSIAQFAFSKYIPCQSISFSKTKGNLAQGLSYEDIVFNNVNLLPRGNVLKIQTLDINLAAFSRQTFAINIFNGKLSLPTLDIVLFSGSFRDGNFNINIYCKNVGVREVLCLFAQTRGLGDTSGEINDFDVYIKGTLSEPELAGAFKIDKLARGGFSMLGSPGNFNLRFKDFKDKLKLSGIISLDGGMASGPNTAAVNIVKGQIIFNAEPGKPSLDLKGVSLVDGVKISITAKGSFEKPELRLSSEPPLPQDELLIMLATGKAWKGIEGSLKKGQLSADLVKDFIDYFIFSGSGSKLAQFFGISDFSLRFDKDKKTIGVKTEVSDNVCATYDVEEAVGKEGQPVITQKAGGEYKIGDSISIGVKKELKLEDKTGQTQDQQKADDEINVKFKKEF